MNNVGDLKWRITDVIYNIIVVIRRKSSKNDYRMRWRHRLRWWIFQNRIKVKLIERLNAGTISLITARQ